MATPSTLHKEQRIAAPTVANERPGRKRPRTRAIAGVVIGALVIGGLLLRETSPVGHFRSAAARDHFFDTYRRAMHELPRPSATLDVRTGYGIVRFYRFEGTNPAAAPLVLLPGRASASPVWADNLPSLLRLRTVYTVDLLGEPGASIQERPIESEADQARWLHEALLQLPEPQVHLLGVSIGGWTAMNLAVQQPEKIASVILLDPVQTFADLSPQVVVRSIPASLPWLPKGWRDSFNSWTANDAPVEDVPVAQMIEAGMQSYALKLPAPTRIGGEAIARLDRPVLVIIAGKSVMHDPAAAAQSARATLKRGTVLTYQEASHAINGEYPERIAADVAAFLATVEPTGR